MMMRRYVIVVVVVSSILLFLFSTIKRTFFVPLVLSLSLSIWRARTHSLSVAVIVTTSNHRTCLLERFDLKSKSNRIKSNRTDMK